MSPSRGARETPIRDFVSPNTNATLDATALRHPSRNIDLRKTMDTVVDISDAGRVVECAQVQRQLRFQHLVRRYLSQILYGCRGAHCSTPTCLTANKQLSSRPHRAPTQLTARALAHFLASQNDPFAGLCMHQLRVSPDALAIDGALGVEFRQESYRNKMGLACNVLPLAGLPIWSTAEISTNSAMVAFASRQDRKVLLAHHGGDRKKIEEVIVNVSNRHQVKKDVKSLGQSLYDTVSVIYSYSKRLPTAQSVYDTLCSFRVPRQTQMRTGGTGDSCTRRVEGLEDDLISPAFTVNAHSRKVTPPTGRAPKHGPIHSHRHPISFRKHRLISHNTETASNGELVHRILHQLPDPMARNTPEMRPDHRTGMDNSQDLSASRKLSNSKRTYASNPRDAPKTLHESRKPPAKQDRVESCGKRTTHIQATSHLTCDAMELLKEETYQGHSVHASDFVFAVDFEPNRRYRPMPAFVNRSLYYSLSDPETLLRSFRDMKSNSLTNSSLVHLDPTRMVHAFRDWNHRNGALIFDSLWTALEVLFVPPPELDVQKSARLRASGTIPAVAEQQSFDKKGGRETSRYLEDEEVAHLVMICIHALTSLVSVGWPRTWVQLRNFRSWGIVLPHTPNYKGKEVPDSFTDPWLNIIDELEYEPAVRLADRLLRGIGARICFEQILSGISGRDAIPKVTDDSPIRSHLLNILVQHLVEVEKLALANKRRMKSNLNYHDDPGWTVTATFMEWLRTVILKKWDGKAAVNKWSSVGVSLLFLEKLYAQRESLNLRTHMFHMPWFDERVDKANEPIEYLNFRWSPNHFHIFQFPCLFQPDALIAYFRTINFTTMYKHYEMSERTARLQRHVNRYTRESYSNAINRRLAVALSNYLVLEVGREHPLEDTLNQLWGQEGRLLQKPLKVKMGKEEGEIGHDQGGITYEFFRVVLGEAFQAENGMFVIDPQTRMTWFQPASLEPDWKFEMLGMLFSLALYNGVTLPVTFPLALYHSILTPDYAFQNSNTPKVVDSIRDGWPALAKSFDELLSWTDGDVADIFMRTYTFSFEACGKKVNVDMQSFGLLGEEGEGKLWPADNENVIRSPSVDAHGPIWPSNITRPPLESKAWERARLSDEASDEPASEDATEDPLVTNANRDQYVRNYIFWLSYRSIAPQLLAFCKGFHSCLQQRSLQLFDAQSLKSLVEGTPEIDVAALKAATRYEEGYSATHKTITDFWTIVQKYSMDDRRKLLEFVTASERVPVTGFETMNFHIVRNGSDTEMLPTSSTCFGKLMLPEYSTFEKLKRKLDLAIKNSKGFGVL